MLIRCVKCKKPFQQKKHERVCGIHSKPDEFKKAKIRIYQKIFREKHPDYHAWIQSNRRRFQNPIYQFLRLGHDEWIVYNRKLPEQLVECVIKSL